ncbi:MAG: hypothetical protein HC838_03700 [Spirulinaceae cyanobacterium RM2_2_10]|nr:hypothetical protein [Spirulinaceae cyanobacterium SM2_1_0]NJO19347.1 hypothetical protein [Spirulinaceae cyanobacterium RM2_2_10]
MLHRRGYLAGVSVIAIAAASLGACEHWRPTRGVLMSAAAVQAQQVAGAEVELMGTVDRQAPFLGGGAYQLTDESGQVWIVTPETLPTVGDRLVVRGTVDYRSVPADGQEWGGAFVRETERERGS